MKNFMKMAFAAILSSAVAFSCSKYDDTELRKELDELKAKVTALETQVAENVSAIQSMVSLGSVQSCEWNAQTGKAEIKLLNGKTLSIDVNGVGTSIVSVMEVDGEYYWGICNDGQTTQLLVDGRPVPVAVTPSVKLSEQNEWMISADGGKTWVQTGIISQGEGSASFFQDVKKEDDYLVLTLMDGTPIKVNVVGEAQFEAAKTSLYFSKQGLEKSVALTEKNLKAYTITEKPEGWKARVDYNSDEDTYTLVVTSPADIAAAAQSGTVKILGVFNGGQNPEIVSVDVAYEQAFTLTAGVGEVVSVTVSENSFEDIDGYIIGVVNAEQYNEASVAEWLNTEEGYLTEPYYETKEFNVSDLVENYSSGQAYLIYAVEHIPVKMMLSGMYSYKAEDLQVIRIGSSRAKVSFKNVTYESGEMSLTLKDVNKYYGGFANREFWQSVGMTNALESINVGNMTLMEGNSYEGSVAVFPDGTEGTQILPATDYVVWIVPQSETPGYQYAEEDFIVYSFKSASIAEDSSIAAPSCEVTDVTYGGFTAKVTPSAGAYKTYAAIRKASAIPEDLTQSVSELIDINNFSAGSDVLTVSANSFNETDEVYLLAVSVTADGHFGEVYKQKVPLKTLTYSDALGVSMTSATHGLGDVTVSFQFTGNPSSVTYYCTSTGYFGDETMQDMLARGQVGDAVKDVQISALANGNSVQLSGLIIGVQYTFYALVKDAAGTPSRMTKITFTPIVVIDYLMSNDSDYNYGMPAISGTKTGVRYSLQITKPEECVKYWLFIGDFEYLTGSSTNSEIVDVYGATDKLVTMQLEDVGAMELEDSYSTVYTSVRNSTRLYMAWLDKQGRYHSIYTKNLYSGN